MKTPEQIAEQEVEGFESDPRFTVNEDATAYTFGYPVLKDLIVSAIEADRAQLLEASEYRVGAPDPTPDGSPICRAQHDVYVCTWPPSHPGQPHVAGGIGTIVAVWW